VAKIYPKRCPHCGKPSSWDDNPCRPFCSERCRLIDLGQWASERYRIPGERCESDRPDKPAGPGEEER